MAKQFLGEVVEQARAKGLTSDEHFWHRGVAKVDWVFTFACAAYNLMRMRNLVAAVPTAQVRV